MFEQSYDNEYKSTLVTTLTIPMTAAVAPSEYETVFVKDMAYYLLNRLDSPDYIPENYIHTFLLRDPKKSVYSLYKMSLNKSLTGKRAVVA